jgi:hypothetical protein
MRAAVEGTWVLEVPATAGQPARTIKFRLAQATTARRSTRPGPVATAAACNDARTLVRSAHACKDEIATKMPLEVELIAGSAASKTRAEFRVDGEHFRSGNLSVAFGDDWMNATLSPAGGVTTLRSPWGDGATLRRTATE